jgi:hypothetical protein
MLAAAVVGRKVESGQVVRAVQAAAALVRVIMEVLKMVVQEQPIQAVAGAVVLILVAQVVKAVTELLFFLCQQANILLHILGRKCRVIQKQMDQILCWLGQVQERTQHEPFCKN